MNCSCGGRLIVLETFCTEAYQKLVPDDIREEMETCAKLCGFEIVTMEADLDWFRDVVKRCVCEKCGKEQEVPVKTVKQDRRFK